MRGKSLHLQKVHEVMPKVCQIMTNIISVRSIFCLFSYFEDIQDSNCYCFTSNIQDSKSLSLSAYVYFLTVFSMHFDTVMQITRPE